jgi:DNA repair protein RadC
MITYKTNTPLISLTREPSDFPKAKIQSGQDATDFIRMFYHDDLTLYESFYLLLLNRANITIGYAKISQGGISGTLVDQRIVCKYAIEALATGVILAHNHPSGNRTPSESDRAMTKRIQECLKVFDIQVLDHIILTEDSFYSFANEGLL